LANRAKRQKHWEDLFHATTVSYRGWM
jgi:hypothetical protein